MEAAALNPTAEAPAPEAPRRPGRLPVFGAAVAAQTALVVAPTALHGEGSIWLLISGGFGAFAAILGILRASGPLLLVGAPLGWAVPGYWLPATAFEGPTGAVALGVMAAWLIVSLWWLRAVRRADAERVAVDWSALESGHAGETERDPLPWIGALLVAAPALGVALWPPVARALDGGFPGRTGQAGALLALLGTLIGLAIATDLARGRAPRRGSTERAVLLGLVFGLSLLLYWALRS